MSGPYRRDTREVIVQRSNRTNGIASILAIAIVAIVVVGLVVVFLGQHGGKAAPAGGGGTTTRQPTDAGSMPAAPTLAAPTDAAVPSGS
jgi:hypothetical protein